jgi:hypothetical protein
MLTLQRFFVPARMSRVNGGEVGVVITSVRGLVCECTVCTVCLCVCVCGGGGVGGVRGGGCVCVPVCVV